MSDYLPPHKPGREYDLYCGEAIYDVEAGDRYAIVGVLSSPRGADGEVLREIYGARTNFQYPDPITWRELTFETRNMYWDLLRVFTEHVDLQFRAVAVDLVALERYWGRFDLLEYQAYPTLHNLYYQLLFYWLGAGSSYRMYWTPEISRDAAWFDVLDRLLERRFVGRAQFVGLGLIEHQYQDLTALAGLLAGAVSHTWNARRTNAMGAAFCADLAHVLGREELGAPAPPEDVRFRVYMFTTPEGEPSTETQPQDSAHS